MRIEARSLRIIPALAHLLTFLFAALAAAGPAPGGKILSLDGEVQVSSDGGTTWVTAAADQPLAVGDTVKTGKRSRCALLLADESQLRLNAYALLTIKALATEPGKSSTLDLSQGQAWFRTKNHQRMLEVTTPSATAAIRGTELLLTASAAQSDLVVTEGEVLLRNDKGAVSVPAGQGGVARTGQSPEAKVVLNPENAAQWVLYYPELDQPFTALGADELAAAEGRLAAAPADGALRLRLIQHHMARREWDAALKLTEVAVPAEERVGVLQARVAALAHTGRDPLDLIEAERTVVDGSPALLTDAAGYHLRFGDAQAAGDELGRALALDPRYQDALAMRGLIGLVQNDLGRAESAVAASLAVKPEHFLTQMVAARVSQARFHMDDALDQARAARELNPHSVEAAATEAELLFGAGDTERAGRVLATAVAEHPGNPRLTSLNGYVQLGLGDALGAGRSFAQAIASDPNRAEAHLGRGLALFQSGVFDEGLTEMLAATTLAPNVSLYQSYLGKAYYQRRRFAEAEAVLDTAKRLDPNDPTPHVYASVMLRDLNRSEEAVAELEQSIAKNGNRGVYRSRLLLDQDRATRGVSIGQLYNQMGFEALGWHQAMRAVEFEFMEAGAQRFLADVVNGQISRNAPSLIDSRDLNAVLPPVSFALANAAATLGKVLLPVTGNSLASFNEYTSLLESPGSEQSARALYGEDGIQAYRAGVSGGLGRIAYQASLAGGGRDTGYGLGTNQRDFYPVVETAVALSRAQTLLVQGVYQYNRDGSADASAAGTEFRAPSLFLAYANHLRPNSTLAVTVVPTRLHTKSHDPTGNACDDCDPELPALLTDHKATDYDVSAAHQLTRGNHQLYSWLSWHRKSDRYREEVGDGLGGGRVEEQYRTTDHTRAVSGMLQYKLRHDGLAFTLGLRRDWARADSTAVDPLDPEGSTTSDARRGKWLPRVGLWWDVREGSTLRLAAFRTADITENTSLQPLTLAGFLVHRDQEGVFASHDDLAIGWDQAVGKRLFATVELTDSRFRYTDDLASPAATGTHITRFYSEADLRLRPHLVLQGSLSVRRLRADQAPELGLGAFPGLALVYDDPRGYRASVRYLYRHQPFAVPADDPDAPATEMTGTAHMLDLELRKALPNRKGYIGLELRNLFNQDYDPSVVSGERYEDQR